MSIKTRMQDSSSWILDSPESLVILMMMGSGMATIFFGLLTYIFGISKSWFLMILFGVFSLSSLRMFIKIFRMFKKSGLKNALGGITAREFVWKKNKYGGIEDGRDGFESDEIRSKSDAKKNKRIREEVGHIYR